MKDNKNLLVLVAVVLIVYFLFLRPVQPRAGIIINAYDPDGVLIKQISLSRGELQAVYMQTDSIIPIPSDTATVTFEVIVENTGNVPIEATYMNGLLELYTPGEIVWIDQNACQDPKTIAVLSEGLYNYLLCTESMKSIFTCEDTLYFCYPTKNDIKVGDIIWFNTPDWEDNLIHRVISISGEGYTTKGDDNPYAEASITPYENVFGKLWMIER